MATTDDLIECPLCHTSGFVPSSAWNAKAATTFPGYRREPMTCPECFGTGYVTDVIGRERP